ncbi:MAG: Translation initiation factor 3 subunit J component [Cirrosporium novae-zelandiae]|nr:MAG: Translation initiation factor 3 subunit J component [Cirrosporium novae-zelandiae]
MAPSKWDDEEEGSTPPTSPPIVARRNKFDDEEEDDDVLESWDAAEDSEEEREKEKKAAEAKAKAEAEAKANHKSKAQRRLEKIQEHQRRKEANETDSSEEEDEADKRQRLRQIELDADMKAAADLFGDVGMGPTKRSTTKPIVAADPKDPTNSINLSAMPLFNPTTKDQFTKLRETLVPILTANQAKPQYSLFLPEFTKALAKDLSSEQIKKIASNLTALSNEKMREEKAAEKGNKKSKASKTKASLVASRDISYKADTVDYGDELGEYVRMVLYFICLLLTHLSDDFM